MKESKFIELLNLYVDHQISPNEAALLESEVRSNPKRHHVYRQYCMMQKACAQLGETFRTDAPVPAAAPELAAPVRRRAIGYAAYTVGLGAAAACIAFIFVARSHVERSAAPQAVAVAAVPPASPESVNRPALQSVFSPRSLILGEQNNGLADATLPAFQPAFGDWMNDVRLSTMAGVSIDDLHFDGHAPLRNDPRTYRDDRPFQGKVEMTAFKFQR